MQSMTRFHRLGACFSEQVLAATDIAGLVFLGLHSTLLLTFIRLMASWIT